MSSRSSWSNWEGWSSSGWRDKESEENTWQEDDSWHEEARSSRTDLRPRRDDPPDYAALARREAADEWWAAEDQWSEWGHSTAEESWQSSVTEAWQEEEDEPEDRRSKRSKKKRKQATFTEDQLEAYEAAFWRDREGYLLNR